jgi:hypothetical protein
MEYLTTRFVSMTLRLLVAIVILICIAADAASQRSWAATLTAQMFPKTGEVRLKNMDPASSVQLVFYSIESVSGALNGSPSVWRSITENYDAPLGATPGNGFVDPNGQWIRISSSLTELAEGALDADGGRILPQRSISLGRMWNPNATPFPDLVFTATALNGQPIDVNREIALDGDYFPGGVVNDLDYVLWRLYYGTSAVLLADGNLNGIVDTADYVVWRNNLGMSVPSLGSGASLDVTPSAGAAADTVPEPANILLAGSATGICLFFARARFAGRGSDRVSGAASGSRFSPSELASAPHAGRFSAHRCAVRRSPIDAQTARLAYRRHHRVARA